jgi:protein tyrosine/serine phosphatase
MKNRILFHRTWSVALAAALICATALTTSALSDDKRASGYAVDIENFGKVNDHFYRGSQPKGRNYEQLAALGVKTIVDLREDADREARTNAEYAGLRYINLPMKERSYPQADAATRFLETINNEANWPVYVHCAGGRHRTGVMTAVYRMAVDSWNIDQAYKEMKQFDFYTSWGHGCYKDYVYDYYRDLQARAQVQVQRSEPATSHR